MVTKTETAVSAPAFPWWIILVEGILALPIVLGVFMIAGGIAAIFFSFRVRSAIA